VVHRERLDDVAGTLRDRPVVRPFAPVVRDRERLAQLETERVDLSGVNVGACWARAEVLAVTRPVAATPSVVRSCLRSMMVILPKR
jgi:hypothetical protein